MLHGAPGGPTPAPPFGPGQKPRRRQAARTADGPKRWSDLGVTKVRKKEPRSPSEIACARSESRRPLQVAGSPPTRAGKSFSAPEAPPPRVRSPSALYGSSPLGRMQRRERRRNSANALRSDGDEKLHAKKKPHERRAAEGATPRRGDGRSFPASDPAGHNADLGRGTATVTHRTHDGEQAGAARMIQRVRGNAERVERIVNVPPSSSSASSCSITLRLSTIAEPRTLAHFGDEHFDHSRTTSDQCLHRAIGSISHPAGHVRSLAPARRVNSRWPTPCTAPSTETQRTRVNFKDIV